MLITSYHVWEEAHMNEVISFLTLATGQALAKISGEELSQQP
jgi:hypothetical protein